MIISELIEKSEDVITYNAGEIIFSSGTVPLDMFVIKSGEVDIIYNSNVLETLTSYDISGEMALIDDKPRSATAQARTDCQLVAVDRGKFSDLIEPTSLGSDFVLHVMKIMADRIRKLNYLISK